MKDRVEDLGRQAGAALQRLARELLARKPGGHLVEPELRELLLELSLPLGRSDSDLRELGGSLVARIDRLLDDAVEQAAVFRPGRAYCHRCRSAVCEHGVPPSCRHVFTGYTATGLPRWEDFAQHCLARKHPEVDRLYDDPPAFVTLVEPGAELHDTMLDAFRNGAYELLGQVVAGYFPLRVRAEEGRGVLALTVQAAMSRPERGPARVGLNLLGRAPGGAELDRLWDRLDELPWRKALRWAQGATRTLRPPRPDGRDAPRGAEGSRSGFEQRIEGILAGLARRLERDQRARGRRTRHAERRHASGERPTPMAIADARAVTAETLKVDERSGTLVVLGDRGRTHFFAPEGRLVSSVRYSKDAVLRKLESGAWRQADAEELAGFVRRVAG